jgi:GT2 family glycosyltransferase
VIRFPGVEAPKVTVAVATYGQWDWVRRTLESLLAVTPPVYEVIVVDNDSPDGTGDRVASEVDGITLIRNPMNEGFGRAINRASAEADGALLCILNSDALVQDGWLPPLLAAMEDPSVGVALPLYLSMDGTVQEAGSTVGVDGVTVPVGRGLPSDALEVAFPRVVDFGSAACMAVRTEAFRSVGGFSEAYGLGYYEDVELCMELRSRGLKSVYVPGATVKHGLGASLSPEEAKARSDANRSVFLRRRWHDVAGRPALDLWEQHPHRVIHARDWLATERVLVLAERLPLDGPTTAALVDGVASRPDARVTVAVGGAARAEDVSALLGRGVEVMPSARADWLRGRPAHATVAVFDGAAAVSRFGAAVAETQPQAAIVYDIAGPPTDGGVAARALEAGAIRSARVVLAPTEQHARFAREIAPDVDVIVDAGDGSAGRTLVETLGNVPADP